MKKIEIFVGSDSAFEKIVPKSARNLSEMAAKLDDGNKKMDVFVNIPGQPEPKSKKKKKPRVQDFIIHADEYCSVQEHVIINFINFIFQMSITNMYIQNPPKNIREQIYRTFDKSIIHETQQPYLEVSKEMIQTFNSQYSERVIGQERAKKKLLQAIYPLVDGKQSKPVVILLYGDSGLGKTESAQYMAELMGGKLLRKQFSINNLPIELTEEEKSHVFVFDEEYIDKNVKFHESGLDTIIMLGHQVEIAEQLQEAQKNLEKAKGEFDIQEKTIIENEKIECKNSPKYHIKKMRLALQGDDCWAGRDKLIKNNRQNTGVRDDTYKQFITLTTTKTRDQLIIEFNETLKVLRIAQQGDAAISTKVPIFNKKYDETNILKLLRTKIERPELSERECYLLELAQTGRSSQLNDMIDIFSNTETYICPTCLQPVSEKYKQDLVQSVQKVLSKTVEEHLAELRTVMAEEIEIDFSPFSKLEMSTNSCLEILAQINMGIRNNNLLIQSKIDNPYSI